jgi:hypothetical protein
MLVAPSFAAAQEPFIELMRADLRADKVAILTESMVFSEAEADVFWPVYREYELELSKLGDRRLELLKQYASTYESLSNEDAKRLANAWFRLQEDHLKLKKKYFGRVEKALSTTIAARFLQVEHQIQLLAELGLASETPLVKPVKK